MPTIPANVKLTKSGIDVLNSIRVKASDFYKDRVPQIVPAKGKASRQSLVNQVQAIGNTIMTFEPIRNEFLNALYNRIGRVLITSKSYVNPLRLFKKGMLDYGETTQEIFVDLINVQDFDVNKAESEVFKRETPDVYSAFHTLNFLKLYKVTVERARLKQAFLSPEGVDDLINYIVDQMTSSMEYDEFLTTMYMVGKRALDGMIHVTSYDDSLPMDKLASVIKEISNNWTFKKRKYTYAGNRTHSPKNDQIIMVSSKFDAQFSTEVLAWVFDKTEAEIGYNRVLFDNFRDLDVDRLNEIFGNDPSYHEFTEDELSALDKIPVFMVDKDWFMIYDNDLEFDEIKNPQGRYYNHFLHVWRTFSVSPFANATLFLPEVTTIESVTVSPSVASVHRGQSIKLTANVVGSDFVDSRVLWTSSQDDISITQDGYVTVPDGSTSTTVVITATSMYDSTVSGNATITIEG